MRPAIALWSFVAVLAGCDDGDSSGRDGAPADGSRADAPRADAQPGDLVPCETDFDCPDPMFMGVTATSLCPAGDRCEDGACVHYEVLDCAVGENLSCLARVCDPRSRACVPASSPDGTPCTDHDPCTRGDACVAGACVGEPYTCEDENRTDCAAWRCQDYQDGCEPVPLPLGTPCRLDDAVCLSGQCDGLTPGTCFGPRSVDCDDGDPCTADGCGDAGCEHTPVEEGTPCDDADPCTEGEVCGVDGCGGGAPAPDGQVCVSPSGCRDAGACASGVCVAEPIADGQPCDDEDACTVGTTCDAGECVGGAPLRCEDDHNPCTDDACVPGKGCARPPVGNGVACDDGPCLGGGTCQWGWCVGLTPAEDGQACALGACWGAGTCEAGRCEAEILADTTPCDDGVACTQGEMCILGTCANGDARECGGAAACSPEAPGCLAPRAPTVAVAVRDPATDTAAVLLYDLAGNLLRALPTPELRGVAFDLRSGDGLLMMPRADRPTTALEIDLRGGARPGRPVGQENMRLSYYLDPAGEDRIVSSRTGHYRVHDVDGALLSEGPDYARGATEDSLYLLDASGEYFERLTLDGAFEEVTSSAFNRNGRVVERFVVPVVAPAGMDRSPSGLRLAGESGGRRRVLVVGPRGDYVRVIHLPSDPLDIAYSPGRTP